MTSHWITPARWRQHAEFCSNMAAYWQARANDTSDPRLRRVFERDAEQNRRGAESAERWAQAQEIRDQECEDDAA